MISDRYKPKASPSKNSVQKRVMSHQSINLINGRELEEVPREFEEVPLNS